MKNNKFVSLSDFENTLVINGFNGEMIEKAEHKVHKYLRKEGGKYIYDYDKMNVKEHEDAAWEHHVQHIVNDTKAEGRKMAKDKELEEHYRKHAAYHKEEKEKHTKLAEEKSAHKNPSYLKIENGKYTYDHSKMTSKDHFDAAELHKKEADKHRNLMEVNKKVGSKWYYEMGHRDMHKKLSSEHKNLAEEKSGNQMSEKDFNNKFDIKYNNEKDTGHIANIVQATDKQTKEMHTYYEDQGIKGFEYYKDDNYGGKGKSYSRNYREGAEPSKNKAIYEHLKRLHSEYYNKKDKSDLKKSEDNNIYAPGTKVKYKHPGTGKDTVGTIKKKGEGSMYHINNNGTEHSVHENDISINSKISKSEAFDILIPNDIDEILEKSRNEHNKPIGQTQSGKNVYHRYDHPEHKSFTKQDHTDAAQIHEDRAYLQYGKAYSKDKSGARTTGNNNRNAYGKMNYSQKQQAKHEAAAGSSENNE